MYALRYIPVAGDFIFEHWDEPDKCKPYLGRTFKRMCEREPGYLYQCCDDCPHDLLKLSAFIGTVELPGCDQIPGVRGWTSWIKAARDISDLKWESKRGNDVDKSNPEIYNGLVGSEGVTPPPTKNTTEITRNAAHISEHTGIGTTKQKRKVPSGDGIPGLFGR